MEWEKFSQQAGIICRLGRKKFPIKIIKTTRSLRLALNQNTMYRLIYGREKTLPHY